MWRLRKRPKESPVTAARLERERSEGLLRVAQGIVRDFHQIRQENHYKQKLKNLIEGDGQ